MLLRIPLPFSVVVRSGSSDRVCGSAGRGQRSADGFVLRAVLVFVRPSRRAQPLREQVGEQTIVLRNLCELDVHFELVRTKAALIVCPSNVGCKPHFSYYVFVHSYDIEPLRRHCFCCRYRVVQICA